MCMRKILRPNIHIRQSTIRKRRCTNLNMEANWDDLRIFLSLAREGTLVKTAKSLGVSHPTVSRRVQALEKQIGARLFERLPDRFVPTAAGEELLADTEAMEKAALSIERRSAGLGDTVSGVVRLSAGEAMAVLVARHLPWLRARLQHIEFEVIASHTLANLSRREADLLIREQVPELAGIVTRKLCKVAYAVYAARDFPLKRTHPGRSGRPALDRLRRRPQLHAGPALAARAARPATGDQGQQLARPARCRACRLGPRRDALLSRRSGCQRCAASAACCPRSPPSNGCWCTAICAPCRGCGRSWTRWSSCSSAIAPFWRGVATAERDEAQPLAAPARREACLSVPVIAFPSPDGEVAQRAGGVRVPGQASDPSEAVGRRYLPNFVGEEIRKAAIAA